MSAALHSAALILLLLVHSYHPRLAQGLEAEVRERLLATLTALDVACASTFRSRAQTQGEGIHLGALRVDESYHGTRSLHQAAEAPPVAVLLFIQDGDASVTVDPGSGGVIAASAVNTTKCLHYAAEYVDTGSRVAPGAGPVPAPGAGAAGVRSREMRRHLAAAGDPALDLSACAALTIAVVTNAQEITVQVKVNAVLNALPPGALTTAGGRVASQSGPRLAGAFTVFDAVVQLTSPNVAVSIVVKEGALSAALGGQPSAPSNTVIAVRDTEPPRVSFAHQRQA